MCCNSRSSMKVVCPVLTTYNTSLQFGSLRICSSEPEQHGAAAQSRHFSFESCVHTAEQFTFPFIILHFCLPFLSLSRLHLLRFPLMRCRPSPLNFSCTFYLHSSSISFHILILLSRRLSFFLFFRRFYLFILFIVLVIRVLFLLRLVLSSSFLRLPPVSDIRRSWQKVAENLLKLSCHHSGEGEISSCHGDQY